VYKIKISAGSDTVTTGGGMACVDFDSTGFTGIFSGSAKDISGNVVFGAGHTINFSNTLTLSATSSKTITTNGVVLTGVAAVLTFNGSGGTWVLQDNLDCGTNTITLTQGTIDANEKQVLCGIFSSSNSNVRSVMPKSGLWNLRGTGTVWDITTSTNMTIVPDASTIIISDTSATANTFAGGGLTYNNITLSRGSGGGRVTFTGSNTFNVFSDLSTAAHELYFTTGTTTSVRSWNVNGTASYDVTIRSTTTTNATLSKLGGGVVQSRYIDIDYITGTPDKVWYMGTVASGSVDGGHNSQIYFAFAQLGSRNKNRITMVIPRSAFRGARGNLLGTRWGS
jgi:hypothetical protein